MKTIVISTAIALLGAAFTVGANAQTGAPSAQETGRPAAAATAPVDVSDAEVGSYARYLMLNGAPRDEAVKAAQNVDHPAASTRFALRRTRSQAPAAPATAQ
jgi:hypothetical protein